MPFQPHWATSTSSSLTNVTIAISISETRSSPPLSSFSISSGCFSALKLAGHCLLLNSGGRLFRDGNNDKMMVVVSEKISEDASGVLTAQLGTGKPIVPQSFYRALSKIALSVIPEQELPALAKTIRWVRYGESSEAPLPKIAAAVVMLPPDPSAQITLYIRKEPHSKMPHVLCEFRLGCYMYVYALPFSERDDGNLLGFFEEEEFKQTFRHYASVPSWSQQDYSGNQKSGAPKY